MAGEPEQGVEVGPSAAGDKLFLICLDFAFLPSSLFTQSLVIA